MEKLKIITGIYEVEEIDSEKVIENPSFRAMDFDPDQVMGVDGAPVSSPNKKKGLFGIKKTKTFVETAEIEVERQKKLIMEQLNSFVTMLDDKAIQSKGYEISGIDLNFALDGGADFKVITVVTLKASVQAGITVKLTKIKP